MVIHERIDQPPRTPARPSPASSPSSPHLPHVIVQSPSPPPGPRYPNAHFVGTPSCIFLKHFPFCLHNLDDGDANQACRRWGLSRILFRLAFVASFSFSSLLTDTCPLHDLALFLFPPAQLQSRNRITKGIPSRPSISLYHVSLALVKSRNLCTCSEASYPPRSILLVKRHAYLPIFLLPFIMLSGRGDLAIAPPRILFFLLLEL